MRDGRLACKRENYVRSSKKVEESDYFSLLSWFSLSSTFYRQKCDENFLPESHPRLLRPQRNELIFSPCFLGSFSSEIDSFLFSFNRRRRRKTATTQAAFCREKSRRSLMEISTFPWVNKEVKNLCLVASFSP